MHYYSSLTSILCTRSAYPFGMVLTRFPSISRTRAPLDSNPKKKHFTRSLCASLVPRNPQRFPDILFFFSLFVYFFRSIYCVCLNTGALCNCRRRSILQWIFFLFFSLHWCRKRFSLSLHIYTCLWPTPTPYTPVPLVLHSHISFKNFIFSVIVCRRRHRKQNYVHVYLCIGSLGASCVSDRRNVNDTESVRALAIDELRWKSLEKKKERNKIKIVARKRQVKSEPNCIFYFHRLHATTFGSYLPLTVCPHI